jgi:hypothetical protein
MIASRGMGAISPDKMPKGVKKKRRDNTDFTEYASGGKVDYITDTVKRKRKTTKFKA